MITPHPKLLAIAPTWIGDLIMAQSLFKALKRQSPNSTLDVVGADWALVLLKRMPEVSHAICADIPHGQLGLGTRWRVGRQLKDNQYDQAFLLSRSLKSALIPWLARIPRRTGYIGESRYGIVNDVRRVNKNQLRQKVQHYVALSLDPGDKPATAVGFEYPELVVNQANRDVLVERYALSLDRPVVALAPGAAYGPIKRWPAAHFASVARTLTDKGYDCWVFGGGGDTAVGDEITSAAPDHCVNFCGKTNLDDVVDLMSLAQTYVGNDTGLMHIASAVIPHVVVLYGPTSPIYTPPLQDDAICLWLNRGDTLKDAKTGPGGYALSLYDLPIDDVVRACLTPGDTNISSRYPVHLRTGQPAYQ